MNRFVKTGAKALHILAPNFRKETNTKGIEEVKLTGFRNSWVFDLSDTQGSDEGWAEAGETILTGQERPDLKLVSLLQDYATKQDIFTLSTSPKELVREIADHLLPSAELAINNFKLESVAYIILSRYNLTSEQYDFKTLSSLIGGDEEAMEILKAHGTEISKVAGDIIKGIETNSSAKRLAA